MKKIFLIICIAFACSYFSNAQEIFFKSCKEIQLYYPHMDTPWLKMKEGDVVTIYGKKDEFLYLKYAKTGSLFRIKIEDVEGCQINVEEIEEYKD